MDSNDSMQQSAFSEEEKLPEVIDEDAHWFDKNLGADSDNIEEHEELNTQINQDDLGVDLDIVKENDLGDDKVNEKSVNSDIEADSRSELLEEVTENPPKDLNESPLESKKDDLEELKDISIDNKKHDMSNELKEMFEEKSSDAEEMNESAMAEHSLDEEITKEDKLKDIVPDDILGKDDSFDELDNDALHQELTAHLTYEKDKELMSDLPDTNVDLNDVSTSQEHKNDQEENQSQLKTEPEIEKSLDDLSFGSKTELLKDLAEDIGVKEIDDIMEPGVPSEEEDCDQKDINSELKDISSGLEGNCVNELKDDLENQLQNITGETEDLQIEQEQVPSAEIVTHVDKANIELNQANMMVEFAHDDGNQVLIQINTDHSEPPPEEPQKSDSLIMKTSDGQTLVFSTETLKTDTPSDNDVVSQVEGGAEFLEAVTGKLEDVLVPVKQEEQKVETNIPQKSVAPVAEPTAVPEKELVKEDPPKCCVTTCKSGKSSLKTVYRYFKPPTNKLLYRKWEYIFNQAKQQLTPNSLICEHHFRTGLIFKRGINRTGNVVWALREGALPKLSPSGILRASGGTIPQSTTIQVPKRPEGIVKSPAKPDPPVTEPKKVPNTSPLASTAPSVVSSGKKIFQKPVKTVATKVSSEVTDIGFLYKNPELVKAAQQELITQDILVCGECHSVFHFLELFQAHKMANNCEGQSNFKGNPSEPKPPVWAFLLWKSAQAKLADIESSWKLYQRWCKMDDSIRNAWISAGKFLQEGHAIASLKLIDSPMRLNKVGRPPLRDKYSEDEDEEFTIRKTKKPKIQATPRCESPQVPEVEMDIGGAGDADVFTEPEHMEAEENSQDQQTESPIVEPNEVEQTLQDISRHTPEILTTEVEIKQEVLSDDESGENKENDSESRKNKQSDEIHNCSRCKKPVTNLRGGIICAAGCYGYFHVECTRVATLPRLSKMGARKLSWKCDTCILSQTSRPAELSKQPGPEKQRNPEKEEEEYVVEKIVSRRFNIKKKHYEYLLKWEGYPSDQNTWEPAENLGTCQHLLKAFEEALAKQQAAKLAAKGLAPPVKPTPNYKVKPPVIVKKKEPLTPGPSTPVSNILSGRPIRSSKKKAMDQVKVWCGSIVRPSDDDVGLKRKASSDSEYEEEVVVKKVKIEGKIKVEQESEDSESGSDRFIPRGRGKPIGSQSKLPALSPLVRNNPVVNGEPRESNLAAALGLESDEEEMDQTPAPTATTPPPLQKSSQMIQKMSSLSPQSQKVLVASAQGVVKVDTKQVPNLSSGVYIMSNKSGIVKVDNTKTLNSLQKSGIMKKPLATLTKPIASLSPNKPVPSLSPTKPNSGVMIIPKAEPNTPQQKVGVVRRGPIPISQATLTPITPAKSASAVTSPAVTTQATTTPAVTTPATTTAASTTSSNQTPGRPAGLLKPKTGILPRPLGMLKPAGTGTPGQTPATPLTRPLGVPGGISSKIQQVRPRTATTPLRGRPVATPLARTPLLDTPNLRASPQQKLLIAKKKAEAEALKPSVTISPVKSAPGGGLSEIRSRVEASPGGMLPIRSTNKVLAHPMLNRGRGRGYRGRGRGHSLAQLVQREMPEAVKESKLIESDNLLMEFQEQSESEESDDGVEDIFNIAELPPIDPPSPPREMTLCPLTGKRLAKAEGEKTPEPTPPPSPKAPTPPPVKVEEPKEPTHILPDHEDSVEMATPVPVQAPPSPVPVSPPVPTRVPSTPVSTTNTAIVKQEGMICKVEMSPGGTTGTLVEAIADATTPAGVTEGTVTIKKPLASRNRINRGPQLSVMPTNSTSTSLGTITVPAKKLFQEENGDDDMVTITGEDGLVYQVSNSELTGNTLLVSSGEDGQQQCVYVTTDADGTEDGSTILTLDTAYADAVAQLGSDQVNILSTENGDQFYIKEGDDEGQLMTLEGEEGMIAGDDQSGQVVAQLVEAGEPAPGGSRRVVLLLPDGNLMMTEVDEEQYAALDLDK